MKKQILSLLLALSASVFAHDLYTYTESLTVVDKDVVNAKILFGHPENSANFHEASISTVPQKAIVFHKGETKDILNKVKKVDIQFSEKSATQYEYSYGKEDGLVGNGHWIFFVDAGVGSKRGNNYNFFTKMIISKGGRSTEWQERVAHGYPEIVPFVDPTNAWVENGFTGQIVDSNGNGVPNVLLHASFINSDIVNNKYVGKNQMEKTKIYIKSDSHGMFHFNPSRAGLWVVGGSFDENGTKKIPNLVIEFK